ncbi:MAG TPA: ribbon-helix-helix protein, CopG family [Thermodesulfobacteriota bacterium]|nr:ribbon-helix-helix protein, CopG family [Thermodesulfobacteriota bacterium]
MRKKLIAIRLDEKVIEKLKKVGEEEGRNFTEVIRQALADFLRKRETKPKSKRRGK